MVSALDAKKHVSIRRLSSSDLLRQSSTLQTFKISSIRTKLVQSSALSIRHSLVVQCLALSWYDQAAGSSEATALTHRLVFRAASPWIGSEESTLFR